MGRLRAFSVSGEEVIDPDGPVNEDGDPSYLLDADPERNIHRYSRHGEYINTHARLNFDLLNASKDLAILACTVTPSGPLKSPPHRPALANPTRAAMVLFGKAFEKIEEAEARACVLARQYCQDLWSRAYFAVENAEATASLLQEVAQERGFNAECQISSLTQSGFEFLPLEIYFELIEAAPPPGAQIEVGFSFTGADSSLKRLGKKLETAGYRHDEFAPALMLLRHSKLIAVDADAFVSAIREVFAISRQFASHYRVEELRDSTVIAINEKLPEKYASEKSSFISRLFGRG